MKEIIEEVQAKWDEEPAIMLNLLPSHAIKYIFHKNIFGIINVQKEDRLKVLLDQLINYYFIVCETWKVEDNTVACEKDKHRSLHDIYLIAKYYWQKYTETLEDFSLEKVIFTLIELVDSGIVHTMYCGTTYQRVYRPRVNERFYREYDTSVRLQGYIRNKEAETGIDFEELCKYYKECKKEQLAIIN